METGFFHLRDHQVPSELLRTMGAEPSAAERAAAPEYYDHPEAPPLFAEGRLPNDAFAQVWRDYFAHMQPLSRRLMDAVLATLGRAPSRDAPTPTTRLHS
ncbi:MAG: hypothetical protein P8R42_20020 [Candidatus Binatia bacterium]|nr:hypothetical protein [Candidatus Binatia bacterium]